MFHFRSHWICSNHESDISLSNLRQSHEGNDHVGAFCQHICARLIKLVSTENLAYLKHHGRPLPTWTDELLLNVR